MMNIRPDCLLHLVAVVVLCGCGGSDRDNSREALESMTGGKLKETVAVSGKVLLNGEPAGRVTISAYASGNVAGEADYECLTKDDGTYCWQTYTECDGLPIGEYQLAFKSSGARERPGAEDKFDGKYLDPASTGFTVKVEAGKPQTEVNYDLK